MWQSEKPVLLMPSCAQFCPCSQLSSPAGASVLEVFPALLTALEDLEAESN